MAFVFSVEKVLKEGKILTFDMDGKSVNRRIEINGHEAYLVIPFEEAQPGDFVMDKFGFRFIKARHFGKVIFKSLEEAEAVAKEMIEKRKASLEASLNRMKGFEL